ncbi:MAG TPA: IS1634 family transposase [Acidimicrobiales bacterium]|nr:IS1634 family transposase [Acidimicrobiales bacterium]
MYLRETRRTNKDGSVVSYLQLAHNVRHPVTGSPVAKVIHSFGRADKVDREALRRLVTSIGRFLDPAEAVAATEGSDVEIVDARRFGGAYVLDELWHRLGIARAIEGAARGRRLDGEVAERVLFALVAQRCLEPASKLACVSWARERVALLSCPSFDDQAAYAAMDFLLDALGEITTGIFDRTANLLNLSCDVIFVDTSSTYWEVDVADEEIELATARAASEEKGQEASGDDGPSVPEEVALRQFSKHSKDHRPDLPQVVIAMAVTQEGIPIRCWTFPGRTSDQLVIRRIKDDLGSWTLNRLLWVTDSGFNSATNRAYLSRGGDHYVVCEKLRSASTDAKAALSRPGRYHLVEHNLSVKEVRVGEGARAERFCVCVNPEAKARDEIVRKNLVAYLQRRIEGSDAWSKQRRDELVGELRNTPGLARFLRRTKDHKLRIDKAAIDRDAHFDGKWLIRSDDDTLTPTDLALAYKQLSQVERGWRDLKGSLRLRPIYHHREDRIRSHVQLCWLGLLLIRVAENATGDTWRNLRHELDRMHLVTLETREGRIAKRSATTNRQREILAALEIREPAQILDYELPKPAE